MKTKIRRILSMLMVFCMMAGLMPAMATTAYADDSVINSVALTIPEEAGEYLSGTAIKTEAGAKYVSYGIHELYVNGGVQGNKWVQLKAGDEVRIEMDVLISNGGYTFAEEGTATVNGKSATYTKNKIDNSVVRVTYSFTVGVTATPSINYDSTTFTVEATGYGTVTLYVDGEVVPNPYTFEQGEKDKTYVVTATAQEEGKDISATESPVTIPAKPSVTLNKDKLSLVVSGTEQLIATVTPDGAEVTWTSSAPEVATVVNGKVTAIAVGEATITATITGTAVSATCEITVEAAGGDVTPPCDHETELKYEDGAGHWSECKCGEIKTNLVKHEFSNDQDTTCDCGYTRTVEKPTPTPSKGGGGSTKYKVTLEDTDNGSVESSRTKASKGTTVTITVDPEAGYEVDDIVVETKAGKEVEVTDKGEGKFTFKMPAANVTVSVDFAKAEVEDSDAKEDVEYIQLTIDSVIAWVFDEYVTNDVAPVIRNARTMLPARFVAEALGGVVTWNEEVQKVTIVNGEDTIEIFIGEPFATVNGAPVELDSPAFIENDRTYLPIRFIAENMGATVTWDADARTVTIVPGE